jgi:lysophospholipid acyltransferase 1/2
LTSLSRNANAGVGNPFLWHLYYTTLDCFRIRTRFYFIWIIADSINNLAGLGFNGYDGFGRPRWDLVTNIYPMDIEFALNMRKVATRWNAQSSNWLRRYIIFMKRLPHP